MTNHRVQRTHRIANCNPREVYRVATDYAAYPQLFPEFTDAQILSQTGQQIRAQFTVQVIFETWYVLDLAHYPNATKTRWSLVDSNVLAHFNGGWDLHAEQAGTRVRLQFEIGTQTPLPKSMTRTLSRIMLATSLPRALSALEREAVARRPHLKAQG